MSASNHAQKLKDLAPRLTLCLAMDLMGSTTAGLKLSSRKLDRFNLALVDQLNPYLEHVQLDRAIVKFTGDGWLVMSDEQEDASKLCCLAIIMSNRFQWDIMTATGLPRNQIPAMRLAICWGRDLAVTLPNGARDFVGNSVRHAVRACQLCRDNEVLVDETVRAWISHDFEISRCDSAARLAERPAVKMEEDLVLHVLDGLKAGSAEDSEAPVYFVNTLTVIGRPDEAGHLASRISDHLLNVAGSLNVGDSQLLARWNELLNSNLDHDTARQVVAGLKRSGLRPNVGTYNALIEKADSYRSERGWIEVMSEEDLAPDVETLNISLQKARNPEETEWFLGHMLELGVLPNARTLGLLLGRAPDYVVAEAWTTRMAALGVDPDREQYELLISKAQEFETAKRWLETMMDAGFEPSEKAFLDCFAKGVLGLSGDELLDWYLGLRFHPAHPIKRAMAEYRKAGRVDDALRLALDYPHTDTALKTIRQYPDRSLTYFRRLVEAQPDHPNGAYALGMALLEVGRPAEATPWLRKAYDLAAAGTRKDELARYITYFDKASLVAAG